MSINRVTAVCVAAALCAVAPAAHAESRAWAEAKKALPSGVQVVAGMNFASIRSSQIFQTLWPQLMNQSGEAKAHLAKITATCKIDLIEKLDSGVIAMADEDKGVMVLGLSGVTQTDVDACFQKVAKADGKKATITTSKDGVVTYDGMGKSSMYMKWLAKDVFMASDDKAVVLKMSAGGIAGDKTLALALGAVKTDASVWMIMNKARDLSQLNAKMVLGYGSASIASGNVNVNAHLVLDSAKGATDGAAQANSQLAAAKKSGQLPPQMADMMKTLSIKAAGSEMVVTASAAEKDVLMLVGQFMGMGTH